MRQAVFSAREETRTVRMLEQLSTGERSVTDASTVWNGVPDQGYNVSSCHYLLPLRLFHRPAFSMQAPHQDTRCTSAAIALGLPDCNYRPLSDLRQQCCLSLDIAHIERRFRTHVSGFQRLIQVSQNARSFSMSRPLQQHLTGSENDPRDCRPLHKACGYHDMPQKDACRHFTANMRTRWLKVPRSLSHRRGTPRPTTAIAVTR